MKPPTFLPSEARRRAFAVAGLRPDALPNLVRVALSRCTYATMTESRWRELAELIGDDAARWVDRHPRLLRSLLFDDEDYKGHVFEFFQTFFSQSFQSLSTSADFLGLRAWVESNDPKLYASLYPGGSVNVLPEVDLANLPSSEAIRENLHRLQSQLDGNDAAATIGTAKDLIESTAKVVLNAAGELVGKKEDLASLIKRAHEVVNLHAKTARSNNPTLETAVKRIREGLQSVALGVVDLRNEVGTGHGRATPSPSGLADDARLAADAAAAWIRSILAAYSKSSSDTTQTARQ